MSSLTLAAAYLIDEIDAVLVICVVIFREETWSYQDRANWRTPPDTTVIVGVSCAVYLLLLYYAILYYSILNTILNTILHTILNTILYYTPLFYCYSHPKWRFCPPHGPIGPISRGSPVEQVEDGGQFAGPQEARQEPGQGREKRGTIGEHITGHFRIGLIGGTYHI